MHNQFRTKKCRHCGVSSRVNKAFGGSGFNFPHCEAERQYRIKALVETVIMCECGDIRRADRPLSPENDCRQHRYVERKITDKQKEALKNLSSEWKTAGSLMVSGSVLDALEEKGLARKKHFKSSWHSNQSHSYYKASLLGWSYKRKLFKQD